MALALKPVRPRPPRVLLYREPVIEALRFCRAVQGTPSGRLLAAALPDLVPRRLEGTPLGEKQGPEMGVRRHQRRHRFVPVSGPGHRLGQRLGVRQLGALPLVRTGETHVYPVPARNKNDGAQVEQKNWHIVRQTVGYHRYDTPGELELLNRTWAL